MFIHTKDYKELKNDGSMLLSIVLHTKEDFEQRQCAFQN